MSSIPKPYDKAELSYMDKYMRNWMEENYEFCLYKCKEPADGNLMACKQKCYKDIVVPFRHANHMGRNNEETLYRKCLANSKDFPNVTQEAMMDCSKSIFAERIIRMNDFFAKESRKQLFDARD